MADFVDAKHAHRPHTKASWEVDLLIEFCKSRVMECQSSPALNGAGQSRPGAYYFHHAAGPSCFVPGPIPRQFCFPDSTTTRKGGDPAIGIAQELVNFGNGHGVTPRRPIMRYTSRSLIGRPVSVPNWGQGTISVLTAGGPRRRNDQVVR